MKIELLALLRRSGQQHDQHACHSRNSRYPCEFAQVGLQIRHLQHIEHIEAAEQSGHYDGNYSDQKQKLFHHLGTNLRHKCKTVNADDVPSFAKALSDI